jgi:prepilin-type N-terminal cleavage/methylation domain-containing protein
MSRPTRGAPDSGITLIEVLVSMALISTLMVALTSFFLTGTRLTHRQGVQQAAVQLAQDGLEQARSLKGPALLSGRASCDSACPDATATGAAAYLNGTERWDNSRGGATPSLPTPGNATTKTLNGITYQRYWYVGKCWQPADSVSCGSDSNQPVALVRVVVAVAWTGRECAPRLCSYVTSALFSGDLTDPVFNTDAP